MGICSNWGASLIGMDDLVGPGGWTIPAHPDWLKEFRDFAWSDSSSLTLHQSARIERTEDGFHTWIYHCTDYDALLAGLEKQGAFAAHSGRVGLPVRRRMSDPVPMGRWVRLLHASTLV